VLTIGVGLNAVTAIHLAVEKFLPKKFVEERALTFSAKGPSWMEIKSLGCSKGFTNLSQGFGSNQIYQGKIGNAEVESYSMKELVSLAKSTLERDEQGLSCSSPSCLSCSQVVV
jgi:aminoglycoside N3'-acetyltransferase